MMLEFLTSLQPTYPHPGGSGYGGGHGGQVHQGYGHEDGDSGAKAIARHAPCLELGLLLTESQPAIAKRVV